MADTFTELQEQIEALAEKAKNLGDEIGPTCDLDWAASELAEISAKADKLNTVARAAHTALGEL